jgi:hypothetical protein
MSTYRMLYTAIPVGTHLQRSGSFGNFATSPVLTWSSLEEAIQAADWNQDSVVTGHYSVIDEQGKEVYRSKGESKDEIIHSAENQ